MLFTAPRATGKISKIGKGLGRHIVNVSKKYRGVYRGEIRQGQIRPGCVPIYITEGAKELKQTGNWILGNKVLFWK